MTELLPNIFAIEVPATSYSFSLGQKQLGNWLPLLYKEPTPSGVTNGAIDLPPGSYEIMFDTSSVTEYQAATISPGSWSKYFENAPGPLFMDYSDNIYRFDNAIKSLQSLLKSKGLTAGNYLIIEKVL